MLNYNVMRSELISYIKRCGYMAASKFLTHYSLSSLAYTL